MYGKASKNKQLWWCDICVDQNSVAFVRSCCCSWDR